MIFKQEPWCEYIVFVFGMASLHQGLTISFKNLRFYNKIPIDILNWLFTRVTSNKTSVYLDDKYPSGVICFRLSDCKGYT